MPRPPLHPVLCVLTLVSLVALAGCEHAPTTAADRAAPTSGSAAASVATTGSPLRALGIGAVERSGPRCASEARRQFDFWLGAWEVFGADGAGPVGTSRVTSDLGGCVIEESWTDAGGGRGRSLNAYDPGRGTWHQFWMDAFGTNLRLDGGLDSAGRMVLAGEHPAFFNGPLVIDRIAWTPLAAGRVRQFGDGSADSGATYTPFFDLRYEPRTAITPAAELPVGFCDEPARFRFHQFDFLLGEWDVYERRPDGHPDARLVVTKDLSGCLIEERLEGRGPYVARSFAAFDFRARTWYRSSIDNDGVSLLLGGAFDGQRMVLTGSTTAANGDSVVVRVTWSAADADRVDQRWELSRDGGATFAAGIDVVLTRR